jgi:3-hydroxymyristoyl/3-hydroxydecanoyl-(acyl carrier protein) dehydratase
MAPADADWLSHPGAPRLLSSEAAGPDQRRLELEVSADTPWVEGHFPDRAVLPGVVELRWAIEAARSCWPELETVRSISNLKFQHPVLPPAQLTLTLELRRGEAGHRLNFRYDRDDQACAQGGVQFA